MSKSPASRRWPRRSAAPAHWPNISEPLIRREVRPRRRPRGRADNDPGQGTPRQSENAGRLARRGAGSEQVGSRRALAGQSDAEGAALAVGTLDPDASAMQLDERLGDGESQAQPGAVASVERLEDQVAVFGGDAGTGVCD